MKRLACVAGVVLLLAVMSALATRNTRAEVAADTNGGMTQIIIVGIIEDLDPIPQVIWEQVSDCDVTKILNADGANRGDGRPHFDYDSGSAWPMAVWAYNHGSEHDIAISRWDGSTWAAPEFLTTADTDDVDPRVFVGSDGTVHVVWWVDGATARAYLSKLAPGNTVWSAPEELVVPSGEARRPSVATVEDLLFLVVERDAATRQEVVLARRDTAGGPFDTRFVAASDRDGPLEPMLHAEQGHLWVDWRHSDTELAYSELVNGSWTAPQTSPWPDASWVGEEQARQLIRSTVLAN